MTYEFRTISSIHFVVTLLLTMFSLMFPIVELTGPMGKIGAIVFSISSIGGSWFIAKALSKGKVKIDISETTLTVEWLKKPLVSFQKNIRIDMTDITGWRFRPDRNFDMFKIFLPENKTIKFERDTFWNEDKDDFGNFMRKFQGLVDKENKKRMLEKTTEIVDKEIEYFKSSHAKVFYYVSIVLTSIAGLMVVLTWGLGKSTPYYLMAAAFGGLFYIMRYRQMTRKD